MKDNFGRDIKYLRISVTDLCNLRCRYCMPSGGVEKIAHENILTYEEIEKIVKNCVSLGINKVRLTGGEPLVRKGITNLIERIAAYNLQDFSITTNGILLEKLAKDLKKTGIKRLNVSLDTLSPQKYKYLTRGGDINSVLRGIEAAQDAGLTPLKINVVLIGGFNDEDIGDFSLFLERNIDVRFIELMPLGETSLWSKKRFISADRVLERFNGICTPENNDENSAAKYYRLEGFSGKIGIINPVSQGFCKRCDKIRLTSDGLIKPCLHSDVEINVIEPLRNKKDILEILTKTIKEKPEKHMISEGKVAERGMSKIGG
ncbi:MAG TPA: GTP 3',8-cyclase MoaA [Spirochaetota bacterium]|nr:GTP 3',8-cyclase MoaA [Spirochaetota bacterium]